MKQAHLATQQAFDADSHTAIEEMHTGAFGKPDVASHSYSPITGVRRAGCLEGEGSEVRDNSAGGAAAGV